MFFILNCGVRIFFDNWFVYKLGDVVMWKIMINGYVLLGILLWSLSDIKLFVKIFVYFIKFLFKIWFMRKYNFFYNVWMVLEVKDGIFGRRN